MMRKLLLWALLALFCTQTFAATTSDTDNDIQAPTVGNTTAVVPCPTAIAVGDAVLISLLNLSNETSTISSISGSVHATGWTLLSGPHDHPTTTFRVHTYGIIATSAGTETVTAVFSDSINIIHGCAVVKPAASATLTFGTAGTEAQGSGTTIVDSNTATLGAGGGGVFGVVYTQGDSTITAGASTTNVSNENARINYLWNPQAGSGSFSTPGTAGANVSFTTHIIPINETAGGGGGGGLLLRRRRQ